MSNAAVEPHHRLRFSPIPPLILAALVSGFPLQAAESLQQFVNGVCEGKQGAVIASDPRTGRILALWNPKTAFQEAFPPGSTAKGVVSAAALEEGVITPSERIACRRIPRLLGEPYRCSHPAADQPFDLAAALANSCNCFFTEVGARLSAPVLAHWYRLFGFGSSAAIGKDTPPGRIRIGDNEKERALASLGEQQVTATPAQVLLAYSAFATQGQVHRLIMPGEAQPPGLLRVIPLKRATLSVLAEGLRECVETGMCKGAAVEDVPVAGKTGTAAALDGSGVTHAWFVGYAPADSPEIAVVVFLRHGTGARNAAPLGGQILKEYFDQKACRR